ncbi:inversin-A-like [Haliotis asinina]|uniref:inversin-A-like n=1 Tax=Haliotis asinina TaxID=109174 RepID=UPI003531C2E7
MGVNQVKSSTKSAQSRSFVEKLSEKPLHRVYMLYKKQNYPEKSPQQKVDKEETFVNSPLHNACRKGNLTQVRRILSQGLVDINSRVGNHGKTPLMVAAQEGHCKIFDFLIRNGANVSQVDDDGKNLLYWSCKGGHVGMVECVLPQYDVDVNDFFMPPLMQAAFDGYRDVCEFLVCMGANVSQVDDNGYNVLHWGCSGGHLDVVKYLLSLCILDINSRGLDGKTPLMEAVYGDYRDIVELLIRKGANVSQVDDFGENVLQNSYMDGIEEIVKTITRENLVNVRNRNKSEVTAAMTAKCN